VEIQWNHHKPSVTAVRHAGLPGRAHVRACSARMSHQERDSFGSGTWVLPAYLSISYGTTHFRVDSDSRSAEKDRRSSVSVEDESRSFAERDSEEEFHRLMRSSLRSFRSRRTLQRKMTIHRQDKMRHSSSWPDRAPQTVKVCVDPLSRAFTIIPTSRETACRSEQIASRSNRLEEIALLDERETLEAVASTAMKRRLVDARSSVSKRSANFPNANTSDETSDETKRTSTNRCFVEARSLSSIEATAIHQKAIILFEGNVFRDQLRCKSDPLVRTDDAKETRGAKGVSSELPRTTSDSDVRELLSKGEQEESADESARRTNESPSNGYPFDIGTNDVADRARMAGAAQTSDSRTRETDGARKKCQTVVSSCSPRHAASSPPRIKVVDYDDYVTSVSFLSRTGRHACPKCTSEGVLRSQIDPFRSPSPSKKNDDGDAATTANARGVRRADSIRRERKKAPAEPRADERQSKDTWHEERLIGEARNPDAKKSEQQRRNDGSRPPTDFRKEATLRRHYYPEGGWGYVVVTCSMLVHFLGVGLQLAAPGCWHTTAERQFKHPPLHSAGKRWSRCS